MLRLNADGSRDSSFGSNGVVVLSGVTAGYVALNVSTVGGQKYLFAGGNGSNGVLMTRLNYSTGALDTTFGAPAGAVKAGYTSFAMHTSTSGGEMGGFDVMPDGRVVVAGGFWHGGAGAIRPALRCLLPDGSFDTSFGVNSSATVAVNLSGGSTVTMRSLEEDGETCFALVAGTPGGNVWGNDAEDDFVVMMFTASGQLDTSFGVAGVSTIDFAGQADKATSAITADGRVVVLGQTDGMWGTGEDLALVRLTTSVTPTERVYARQDANFNVTSTVRAVAGANGVLTTSAG